MIELMRFGEGLVELERRGETKLQGLGVLLGTMNSKRGRGFDWSKRGKVLKRWDGPGQGVGLGFWIWWAGVVFGFVIKRVRFGF